jgi:SnoaL-like domain
MDAQLECQLKELLDKHNINETLVRMTRGFSRLDTGLVEAAFHDDAVFEHWQFAKPVTGNKAIATALIDLLKQERFSSVTHLLMQSNTELRGDVAFSENHMLSCQVRTNEAPERTYYARVLRAIHRWERRDGKTWKAAYRTVLLEGFEFGGQLPESGYPPEAYGKRGPRDITYHWEEALRPGIPYQWK